MTRTFAPLLLVCLVLVGCSSDKSQQIQYRYAAVKRGELVSSITATGLVTPLTTVDIKCKAGGEVMKLFVDLGSVVKTGQLIALVDPRDTQAAYQQAAAALAGAKDRAEQAKIQYDLQRRNTNTAIANAREALQLARIRLVRADLTNAQQPSLTKDAIAAAQEAYDNSVTALQRLLSVTIPQMRSDAVGTLAQDKAAVLAANANLARQKMLVQKGYVAQSVVETSEASAAQAEAAYISAQRRIQTLPQDIKTQTIQAQLAEKQARTALDQAAAQKSNVQISTTNYQEAQENVRTAETTLQTALDAAAQVSVAYDNYQIAQTSMVDSQVAVKNALVQLQSTTVVAPRPGVITTKYVEQGTIIPPGESLFATGTSIVQLSDESQLFVDCGVDETDIGSVKLGQRVRITADAYPDTVVRGIVYQIDPSAITTNSITTINVRVRVLDMNKVKLEPGMNASCEFLTLDKPNVLLVPDQAVNYDNDGNAYVMVGNKDPQHPVKQSVTVGDSGNDEDEIVSGLSVGDKVVTATIDIAKLLAAQRAMQQAQQGGGLAGGPQRTVKKPTLKKKK